MICFRRGLIIGESCYKKGTQMRKAIVYASVHHGNTEKLVKGIVEECQVDLIDAVKQPDADLSRKFAPIL